MPGEVPKGYRARPATEADLDVIVRLAEAIDASYGLPPSPTREFLRWAWHISATDLERDTRIIGREEVVAGFGQAIWRNEQIGPLNLDVYVHPDHRSTEVATSLLSWGESVAWERGAKGVRTDVPEGDTAGHGLLHSRGYEQVRSAFTMAKTVGDEGDVGPAPDEVTIRRYVDADERALFEVNQASFADIWGFHPSTFETFNEELHAEDWDPSLVFLAEGNGDVVGHVVSFLEENQGYVAMLGVIEPWRGRGIARALLCRAFAEISTRGRTQVKLDVDAQNPHGAVALYEGVGMTVDRRSDLFELWKS